MHGAIVSELQSFVVSSLGRAVWNETVQRAGLPAAVYMPTTTYRDEEVTALVRAAAQLSGKRESELLSEFGEYLAPQLFAMYRHLIDPAWRTLDLIEHTEATIHRVLRIRDRAAKPPELRCRRVSESEVTLTYDSERRLCALAIGLARGFARHYGESIDASESQCMNDGAEHCELRFRRVDAASA